MVPLIGPFTLYLLPYWFWLEYIRALQHLVEGDHDND